MASNLSLAVKLTLSSAEFRAALKSSNDEVRSFAQKMGTQLRSVEPQLKGLSTGFGEIGSAIRSTIAIAGGALGAGSFLQTLQAIQNTDTRLRALSGSTQEYARAQAFLTELSASHHKSQLDLAQSYARLQALEQAGTVTREQAERILTGLSNAQSATGASAEQLNQAMFGLAQGLSAGTLRAEELNQVTEPMPGLLQRLDQAAGLAAGGFRRMVNEGQVTSEMFATTLVAALGSYEGAAAQASGNITAKFADLEAAYQRLVKVLEGPIAAPLSGFLSGLAEGVDAISAAIDRLNARSDLMPDMFRGSGQGAFSEEQQLAQFRRDTAAIQQRVFGQKEAEQALTDKITAEQLRNVKSPTANWDKAAIEYQAAFLSAAAKAGIDPNLLPAVAKNESGFNPRAVSPTGATGQFQFTQATARQYNLSDRTDPVESARAAAELLRDLLAQFKGNLELALAAYKSGPGNVRAAMVDGQLDYSRLADIQKAKGHVDYANTQKYVTSILTDYQKYSGGEAGVSGDAIAARMQRFGELKTVGRASFDETMADLQKAADKYEKDQEQIRDAGRKSYDQMLEDLATAVEEEKTLRASVQSYAQQLNAQAEADFARSQTAQRDFLQTAFDEKLISARDYYAALQKLADSELQHTQQRIDAEIELEKGRLAEINKTIEALAAKSQSTVDLQVQQVESLTKIESLTTQKKTADEKFRSTSREITVDATKAQTEGTAETNPITAWADQFNTKLGDMSSFAFSAAQGMQNAFAEFFESGMQGTESLGASFAKMARRIAAEIAAMMMTKAIISFIGMLGGGLSGMFSSAAAVPSVGATAIGASTPGLATGGLVGDPERTAMTAINGSVQKLIDSSQIQVIHGPGTGTSDSIAAELPVGSYILRERAMRELRLADGGTVRARVSSGEGFVPPRAVRAIGVDALDRINSLGAGLRTFATGGLVDSAAHVAGPSIVEGDTITVNMPLTVSGMAGGQNQMDAGDKAQALKRELREAVDNRIVELQRPGGLLWGSRG